MEFEFSARDLISLAPEKCQNCWQVIAGAFRDAQQVREGKITADEAGEKYSTLGNRCLTGVTLKQSTQERVCASPELWQAANPNPVEFS